MLTRILAWIKGVLRRNEIDAEVDDELRFHIEMSTQANIERGMTAAEGRRAALLDLGGITQTREAVWYLRRTWFDSVSQDLRYCVRRLLRAPGFTLLTVLTLGLGIGANASLFTVVNGVLLKPLSLPAGDRLVAVSLTENGHLQTNLQWTLNRYRRLRDDMHVSALDGIASVQQYPTIASGAGGSRVTLVEAVGGEYFRICGVRPRLGRLLTSADDQTDDVAVVSERFWAVALNRNPAVVGASIRLSGAPFTVIGVASDGFDGLTYPGLLGADAWVSTAADDRLAAARGFPRRKVAYVGRVYARLRADTTLRRADTEIRVAGRGIDPAERDLGLALLPAAHTVVPPQFTALTTFIGMALLALSALVVLIACANLANLMLARGSARAVEIAIRAATGASRARLLQLLLVETTTVTLLAAALGCAIATWSSKLLSMLPVPEIGGMTLHLDATPDWHLFAYTFALAAIVAAAVGIFPAVRVADLDPLTSLVGSGAHAGGTPRRSRYRTGLVAVQVGASVVLLITAGLFVHSTVTAMSYDPGIDVQRTAMARFDFGLQGVDDAASRRLYGRVVDAARAAPGVAHAALVSELPVARARSYDWFLAEGQQVGLVFRGLLCRSAAASPGLFEVLGFRFTRGRDFSAGDESETSPVAIITESVASALWPGQDPIGRKLGTREYGYAQKLSEVVGVVRDTDPASPEPADRRCVFVPIAQKHAQRFAVVARGPGDPASLAASLAASLRRSSANLAPFDVRPIAEEVGLTATGLRLAATTLSILAALGCAIAVLGLYAVIAYLVSLRTREFGIRKALGASNSDIYRTVSKDALRMLATGLLPGVLAAAACALALRHYLVGIHALDPLVFIVVPAFVAVACVTAALVPAARAGQIEPISALRCE